MNKYVEDVNAKRLKSDYIRIEIEFSKSWEEFEGKCLNQTILGLKCKQQKLSSGI